MLGRALWRWLEKLADDEPAPLAPAPATPPVTVEFAPDAPHGAAPDAQPGGATQHTCVVGRAAMGSLFEVHLVGPEAEASRPVAEEALDEVERLDRQFSHYRTDSDITRLNIHASEQWVRLEPRLHALLRRCADLSAATDGAFDITAAPLVRLWGFHAGGEAMRVPDGEAVDAALAAVGSHRLAFDDDDHLVHFTSPGMEVGLGAVGKGHAIDEAVARLRFYGLGAALVHGGQSTIYALGAPPGQDAWTLTLRDPRDHETPLHAVALRDQALSTSAAYEQGFEADGVRYGHIIDPRTGRPAQGPLSVWVTAPTAEESDALATAFYVMGPGPTEEYVRTHPNIGVVMACEDAAGGVATRLYGTLADPSISAAHARPGEQG